MKVKLKEFPDDGIYRVKLTCTDRWGHRERHIGDVRAAVWRGQEHDAPTLPWDWGSTVGRWLDGGPDRWMRLEIVGPKGAVLRKNSRQRRVSLDAGELGITPSARYDPSQATGGARFPCPDPSCRRAPVANQESVVSLLLDVWAPGRDTYSHDTSFSSGVR